MYSMENRSKIFHELKYYGLCLAIWPVEIGELLCIENVDFLSPLHVHYFSNASENSMMRDRNITGAMLSPCLTTTLKGIEV